jgi:hypothetical protein
VERYTLLEGEPQSARYRHLNVEGVLAERRSIRFEHKPLADTLHTQLEAWLATETEESKWGRKPARLARPR